MPTPTTHLFSRSSSVRVVENMAPGTDIHRVVSRFRVLAQKGKAPKELIEYFRQNIVPVSSQLEERGIVILVSSFQSVARPRRNQQFDLRVGLAEFQDVLVNKRLKSLL